MAITNLTGTKWLLEQGWTATSGFGQFSILGVVYDTNDSLYINEINGFNIGYSGINFDTMIPAAASNNILVNFAPTALTPAHYYEFEITGGTDVTNPTLINWLETNATQIKTISDKLQDLIDIKQDIKEAIENKDIDLTGVDFDGYAGKIDELPAVVELTQAQYDALSPSETWLINEILDLTEIDIQINFTAGVLEPSDFTQLGRHYLQRLRIDSLVYMEAITQNYITCYSNYSWVYPDYRTITFETAPTGELLTWLEANAVKQKGSGAGYDDNTYYLIVEEE